jgi:hypothetical protein
MAKAWSPRDAAAALEMARAHGDGLAMCAAKEVAMVALWLQAEHGADAESALKLAAQAFGASRPTTRGGLKKIASEARAILQFGAPDEALSPRAGEPANLRFARLIRMLQALSLRQITQARALTLAGVRGGRPTAGGRSAYAAVERLLQQAQDGCSTARSELTAIQDLMVSGARSTHMAGHRAASR